MSAKRLSIGDPKWRPSKVHPLAALFPVLSEDDLQALAEHIKAHGLLHPVVIDDDGVLIDGRMRLRACDMSGVDPRYERLNGHDAEAFIWGANRKRRQMTQGQFAMIAVMDLVAEAAKENGNEITREAAAKSAGVSLKRIDQALAVSQYAPHLTKDVADGKGVTLDAAYEHALGNKREMEWRTNGLAMLRASDRDLAQKVEDGETTLEEARATLDKHRRELEAMRDSVLLGIASGLNSLAGFDLSEALPTVTLQLRSEVGQEHLRRYFKGGTKELGERIAAAKLGLAAVERAYKRLSGR